MKTQIYTMQTVEEALAVAALGVDLIGLTPSNLGLPGEITNETARAIRDAAHGKVTVVALTVETDFAPIIEMVNAVQPDILHLCPPQGAHTPEQVRELRAQLPEGIGIMQAISVADQSAVDEAIAFGEVVDYIILDTVDPNIAGIGASGKTHDWNISRAIVEGVKIPVILAGGLAPDNVAEAIRKVQPWGVDSLSHTNQPLPEGGFKKDLVKIEAFVKAAREA